MRPNILVYMTDQEQGAVLHRDHPCVTPNAVKFAEEGVFFHNAFCPTTHCCPARATFMTGLYPSRHGIYNNVMNPSAIHYGVYDGVKMFSELLSDVGYNLTYAGKWHVTAMEEPSDREWEQVEITSGRGTQHYKKLEAWRSEKLDENRRWGEVVRPGWGNFLVFDSYESPTDKGYEDHYDYPVIRAGIDALPGLAQAGKPWFLFIGPVGPHDPFIAEKRFVDMYNLDDIPLPPNFGDTLTDKPNVYRRMREQFWSQLSDDEIRDSIRHYWAFCTMEDFMFGEVLAALEATGQADNTLVLRLSDHGDYCGAHGLYLKGVPSFREAYNIAMIARFPKGIIRPGREDQRSINLSDFMPTFLELAEVQAPYPLTGHSFLPLLRDEQVEWDNTLYTQFNGVELYYSQRIVATKTHKYVYNGFDFDELYDLVNDPYELKNVAQDPAYKDVKHDLVRKMWRFAEQEKDEMIFNPYGTVAFAPWGPADALQQGNDVRPTE
jgi:arylsulfatase A-like enzyme